MATQISTSVNSLQSSSGDSSTMVGSPRASLKPIPPPNAPPTFTKPSNLFTSSSSSSPKYNVPPPIIDLTILNFTASELLELKSNSTSLPTLKGTTSLSNTVLSSAEPSSLTAKKSAHSTSSTSNTSCSSSTKEKGSISKDHGNDALVTSKPKKSYPKDTKYPKKKSSFLMSSSSRTRAFSYPFLESGVASTSSSHRKSAFTMDREYRLPGSPPISPPSSPPLSPSSQSSFSRFINSKTSSFKSRPTSSSASSSSPISPTSPISSSSSCIEPDSIRPHSPPHTRHPLPYAPRTSTSSISSSLKQVKEKPILPDPWHTIINEPRVPPNFQLPVTSSTMPPPTSSSTPSTSILNMDLIPLCLERKKKLKKRKQVSFNLHLNETFYVKKYSHSLVYVLDPFEDFEICTCGIDTVWQFLKEQCCHQFSKVWKRWKSKPHSEPTTPETETTTTTPSSSSSSNDQSTHHENQDIKQQGKVSSETKIEVEPIQRAMEQVHPATLLSPSSPIQEVPSQMEGVKEQEEEEVEKGTNFTSKSPVLKKVDVHKTNSSKVAALEKSSIVEKEHLPLKTGKLVNDVHS